MKNESEVAQLCPTPSDPMDYTLPGSSVHGIFQARVLEWGAIAFSRLKPSLKDFEHVNELNCMQLFENSLGLEWKLTFSSPVAIDKFSKFSGILSVAL